MGHLLSGFTVRDNIKVQNAIIGSNAAIDEAYKEVTRIKSSGVATTAFTRHFGAYDADRVDQVWRVLNMMQYATSASFIRYERDLGDPNNYAAAYRPQSGWSEKNVKQILDRGEFRMGIGDMFYAAATPAWEQTLTIAHELSHLVGNTEDEDCPWDGETAYGRERVRRLADRHPDIAISNADNYGYYVVAVVESQRPADEVDLDMGALFG